MTPASTDPLRVAIIADLAEEHWPSMDLVANMLAARLGGNADADVRPTLLRPRMVARLSRLPGLSEHARALTIDRVLNRFWDYPRWLRTRANEFDVFHIVDHTYAHLALELPAGRTIVTCHDVDAFLAVVDPAHAHSALPRRLVARLIDGIRRAATVACVSQATRNDVQRFGLASANQTVVVHNGVDPVFSPAPSAAADAWIRQRLGPPSDDVVDLLHVGSTIPRKRIEDLLAMVARLRSRDPRIRLIKAGGRLTEAQQQLAWSLGLAEAIITMPFLTPEQLAALYRRARLLVLPPDREGFCLPVIEALACGTAVVASDLPVLREIGGDACTFVAVGQIEGWSDAIMQRLETCADPSAAALLQQRGLSRAAAFSWERHAQEFTALYRRLAPQRDVRRAIA